MSSRPRDAPEAASGPVEPFDAPHAARPLRPDARRNTERVLSAARQAFAAAGLDAGYHDIARLAGVGVGTVYRRFPDRAKLMEAVLLDILDELSGCAEQALARTDAWPAFADFFTALAFRTREHAGLSESLDERGGPLVAAARHRLINLIHTLADRAQRQGVLRSDLAWRDIPFLARVAAFGTCALDVPGDAIQAQRCIIVVLDGMRATAVSPLPSHAMDGPQKLAIPRAS